MKKLFLMMFVAFIAASCGNQQASEIQAVDSAKQAAIDSVNTANQSQ